MTEAAKARAISLLDKGGCLLVLQGQETADRKHDVLHTLHCLSSSLESSNISFWLRVTPCGKYMQLHVQMYIIHCLDRTRGFSVDQPKGKQLSLTFRPDALVVFRAKVSPEDD